MAGIGEINTTEPADNELVANLPGQQRTTRANIAASFPNFTIADDVVTKSGTEINDGIDAANTADALSQSNESRLDTLEPLVSQNTAKLLDLGASQVVWLGSFQPDGTWTEQPQGWGLVTKDQVGEWTIAHNTGRPLVVVSTAVDSQAVQRGMKVVASGINTFTLQCRSGTNRADPDTAVNFLAIG